MSWQQFKHAWLIKFWAPIPAVIAAGILSTYYFGITGTFWAVTGEFTRWGGQLLQLFGVHAEEWGYFKIIHLEGSPLTRIDGMMILGMFGGCFAAALWANNVKLRMPRSRIRIMQAIIGGIIAGFGARLAMGCNLAAFFTGIPQFSLHAWFFAIATCHWFMVWRALYPAAHLPYSRENAESFCRLTADAKTGSGAASFSSRDAGLFRHAGLGAAHGDEPTQTGAGNAVWRRLWFTD